MTDRQCGTCTHWGGHYPEPDAIKFKHHPCKRIQHDDKWETSPQAVKYPETYDEETTKDALDKVENFGDSAVVQDGSGYYAVLKTREDFGCIYWDAKPYDGPIGTIRVLHRAMTSEEALRGLETGEFPKE